MPKPSSVLSRFRVTGALIIVGIGLVAAVFYALVSAHYFGTMTGQTLGPYSDALAEHGFADPQPEVWQQMAARHRVMIRVEPAVGEPFAFDTAGGPLAPDSPRLAGDQLAVRTAADGTRVGFYWTLIPSYRSHIALLGGLLVVIGTVVFSAFWFLQRQLQPLAALRGGVEAVARGNFATRVPIVRNDEIGQVAKAFNTMAGRVGEMVDDRERLLADVSHELRSPVARMKVALEFIPAGDKRCALARDLREMENLIAVLLEREALRSRAGRLAGEEVDLVALAGDVVAGFAGRDPGVEFNAEGAARIVADPALIRLLLQNLIGNGVKFSRPDSQPVELLLEPGPDAVVLRVRDDGIGIPAGSEERLFRPFVKLDRARGHGVGYGIGLNLCQRIVRLHGGTLCLRPRESRGTEAVVDLPRRPTTGWTRERSG